MSGQRRCHDAQPGRRGPAPATCTQAGKNTIAHGRKNAKGRRVVRGGRHPLCSEAWFASATCAWPPDSENFISPTRIGIGKTSTRLLNCFAYPRSTPVVAERPPIHDTRRLTGCSIARWSPGNGTCVPRSDVAWVEVFPPSTNGGTVSIDLRSRVRFDPIGVTAAEAQYSIDAHLEKR
jgi:hypothetical protein